MKLMDKAMELIVMNSIPLKIHVASTGEIRLPYQNGDKVNMQRGDEIIVDKGGPYKSIRFIDPLYEPPEDPVDKEAKATTIATLDL